MREKYCKYLLTRLNASIFHQYFKCLSLITHVDQKPPLLQKNKILMPIFSNYYIVLILAQIFTCKYCGCLIGLSRKRKQRQSNVKLGELGEGVVKHCRCCCTEVCDWLTFKKCMPTSIIPHTIQ